MTVDNYIEIAILGICGGFSVSVLISLVGFSFYKLMQMIGKG